MYWRSARSAAWAASVLLAACTEDRDPTADAELTADAAICTTEMLPEPLTLTSTSGAELEFPRLDPATGDVFALEVVNRVPRDVVALDETGRVRRRLGLGAKLRTVPLDFALARRSPWIVFSGRDGISLRTLEPGSVQVILPGRLGIEPEISPDGRRLVFRENTRLYEVALTETGAALGEPTEIILTQSVGAMRPRFSPAGDRVAYFMGGVIETYEFATLTRRVIGPAIGQGHVAWLDAERIAIADDRGVSILREDCIEATLGGGAARHVDARAESARIVFSRMGEPGLLRIDGVPP